MEVIKALREFSTSEAALKELNLATARQSANTTRSVVA
jgi:hypothetical protein